MILFPASPIHRALSELSHELSHSSHTVHTACLTLNRNLRLSESSASVALEQQTLLTAQLEEQLKDKVRDMIQLQVRCDMEKAELSSRYCWHGRAAVGQFIEFRRKIIGAGSRQSVCCGPCRRCQV